MRWSSRRSEQELLVLNGILIPSTEDRALAFDNPQEKQGLRRYTFCARGKLTKYPDGVDALTAGTRPHRYRRRKCGILSVMSCLMKAADTLLCISLEDLATSLRWNKVRRRQAGTPP